MSETLSEKQRRFTRDVALLIQWAYAEGFELTLGEAHRTPEQAAWNAANGKGISNSLHIDRLAIDLMLWVDGKYTSSFDGYVPLGQFWKSLGEDHAWGGDFASKDAVHFSIAHGGRK